jgi:hypothetical protein
MVTNVAKVSERAVYHKKALTLGNENALTEDPIKFTGTAGQT